MFEPKTPGRDPANIDRKGLIGVGELATPRWVHPREGPNARVEDERDSPPPGIEQVYESQMTPAWVLDTFEGLANSEPLVVSIHFPYAANLLKSLFLLRHSPSMSLNRPPLSLHQCRFPRHLEAHAPFGRVLQ